MKMDTMVLLDTGVPVKFKNYNLVCGCGKLPIIDDWIHAAGNKGRVSRACQDFRIFTYLSTFSNILGNDTCVRQTWAYN